MRELERKLERRRLDVELRWMRRAGPAKGSRRGLLRAVRLALGIPVSEITGRLGVGRTAVFDLETREMRQTATVGSMARMARAMGCKLVYGIVPENGKTLEWLAEERLWRAVLGGESTE